MITASTFTYPSRTMMSNVISIIKGQKINEALFEKIQNRIIETLCDGCDGVYDYPDTDITGSASFPERPELWRAFFAEKGIADASDIDLTCAELTGIANVVFDCIKHYALNGFMLSGDGSDRETVKARRERAVAKYMDLYERAEDIAYIADHELASERNFPGTRRHSALYKSR